MASTRDYYKRTELHYAAMDETAAPVERLLAQGFDVAARDRDAFTPLHLAAMHGRPANARLLLDAGAEVDACDRWGNTPLLRALSERRNAEEMVALLRERGADPYRENRSGNSPISTAYRVANFDLKRLFSDLPEPAPRVQ